jgi:ferrous iron transport protein B
MFLVYFFGMFVGLLVTGFVSRSSAAGEKDLPFVLEMPAYRLPACCRCCANAGVAASTSSPRPGRSSWP